MKNTVSFLWQISISQVQREVASLTSRLSEPDALRYLGGGELLMLFSEPRSYIRISPAILDYVDQMVWVVKSLENGSLVANSVSNADYYSSNLDYSMDTGRTALTIRECNGGGISAALSLKQFRKDLLKFLPSFCQDLETAYGVVGALLSEDKRFRHIASWCNY
jgi:hypothetical protein